jgi:PAS domain S-box-containing protein
MNGARIAGWQERLGRPDFRGTCATLCLAVLLAVLLLVARPVSAEEPPPAKNVLFIYSFSRRDTFDSLEHLKSVIRTHVGFPVNFDVEYLDSQRFRIPGYEKGLNQTLREAYRGKKFDAVVVGAYPALRFAVDHRDAIFPSAPIVFLMVAHDRVERQKLWPGVTGITIPADVPGTIDLVLRLGPDTKNVAVLAGNSEFEQYWLEVTLRVLRSYGDRLNVTQLVGMPPDQLLKRVAALPSHTAVLFELIPSESPQPVMGVSEMLTEVSKQFPTYCIHNYCLDQGAVGGSYPDGDEQIEKGGELVARVLSGEDPEKIPMVHGTIHHVKVDWRQLRRWKMSESNLPAGAIVLYRQPSLWERDRNYIIAAIALIVVQSLLIIGLLWQRGRKREAEAILRESEKRFRVMADTTPSLVWMCDEQGTVTYLNDRRLAFTGSNLTAGYGDSWSDHVHPDDLTSVLHANSQALQQHEPYSKEYRLRRRDGVYRWMFDVASPRVNGDGSFAGFIGSAIDITDQKLAQEALEKVSGRLIEAQEKERSRIARDLHDDICQRLALLSMELEQADRGVTEPSAASTERLEDIREHCSEIAADVQALSHQLHSPKLDYLGIVAALRGFCREYAKQHDVDIDFTDDNVPAHLPKEVALCLFRVAQEALHNSVKYSGMRQFNVRLSGTATEVQLTVTDAGAGFDVDEARTNGGLGLISMQERVHLVEGRFEIESRPGAGTKIIATVPAISVSGAGSAEAEGAA